MKIVLFVLVWLMSDVDHVYSQADSLSLDEYLFIIKRNHPIMNLAQNQLSIAEANNLMSRGGFDPKVSSDFDHKSFDGKNYYRTTSAKLSIPTWYGIELNAGYERASGEFLNPENDLPVRGLWNAGI